MTFIIQIAMLVIMCIIAAIVAVHPNDVFKMDEVHDA